MGSRPLSNVDPTRDEAARGRLTRGRISFRRASSVHQNHHRATVSPSTIIGFPTNFGFCVGALVKFPRPSFRPMFNYPSPLPTSPCYLVILSKRIGSCVFSTALSLLTRGLFLITSPPNPNLLRHPKLAKLMEPRKLLMDMTRLS